MSIIMDKLKNNLDLNKQEQKLLEKEYRTIKLKNFSTRFSIFFFIFLELMFLFFILSKIYKHSDGGFFPVVGNRVSVVPLDKPIDDIYADKFISKITKLYENKHVKAIIISLRSPGGSPSASWRIADTVHNLQKENKKPVYTYVESAAVSGSYMIASQSNKIYSNPFAIIGSIGVIIEHLVFEDLSKKIGVEQETLTAGKYKKVISSFSLMNEEQKDYLRKNLLDTSYEGFVSVVAKGRGLPIDKIKEYAEGRIFLANDSRIQGILVDKVINWYEFKNFVYNENNLSKDKIGIFIENIDNNEGGLFNFIGTTNFNVSPNLKNNIINSIK